MFRSLILALFCCQAITALGSDDAFYPVSIPLKQERKSKLPDRSQPADKLEYGVWIPAEIPVVRGLIVNPFSKNPSDPPAELKHWHELSRIWEFAYVLGDFNGASSAEFGPSLQAALEAVARESNRPELAHAPFLFMGTSRGGGWSKKLAQYFPSRTIAVAPTNLVIGPDAEELLPIPFWTSIGERDGSQFKEALAQFPAVRKGGGLWGLAPLWGRGHEFGFTNELAIPFFDEVIRQRYPPDQLPRRQAVTLKPYPSERLWLGDISAWTERKHLSRIAPAEKYGAAREQAACLPGPDLAHAWLAFVSEAKGIKITEPPGLGGGQPFLPHLPEKPIRVRLEVPAAASSVSLFAGERLLERKDGPAAEFTIQLATGVHPIYAVVESDLGRLYSRPHTLIVRRK